MVGDEYRAVYRVEMRWTADRTWAEESAAAFSNEVGGETGEGRRAAPSDRPLSRDYLDFLEP